MLTLTKPPLLRKLWTRNITNQIKVGVRLLQTDRSYMATTGTAVEAVDIDEGTFKYVLIAIKGLPCNVLRDGASKDCMYVVRGNQRGEYHADIFEEFEEQFKKMSNLRTKCLGGGRIKHEPLKKHIIVYGYSQGFGRADHSITCDVLKTKYKDYQIEWNNDGY